MNYLRRKTKPIVVDVGVVFVEHKNPMQIELDRLTALYNQLENKTSIPAGYYRTKIKYYTEKLSYK